MRERERERKGEREIERERERITALYLFSQLTLSNMFPIGTQYPPVSLPRHHTHSEN